MNNYLNNFKIGGLITSIVLGAGFLSGKELLTFFGTFKTLGILGIFISSFLIFLVSISVMKITYTYNIKTVDDFLLKILNNNKLAYYFFSTVSITFMFVIFSTMTSAFSEVLKEYFNIPTNSGGIIFGVITIFFIFFGIQLIIDCSAFVSPILFIGSLLILIYYLFSTYNVFSNNTPIHLYSNAIVYTSYNILTTIALLISSTKLLHSKKDIFLSAFIGSLSIFLIGTILYIPINIEFSTVYNKALPLYNILIDINNQSFFLKLYILNFLIAIITTGVTSCYGVVTGVSAKKNIPLTFLIVFLGILFSKFGFTTFVNTIFPIFGIFGIIEIYFILRLAINRK